MKKGNKLINTINLGGGGIKRVRRFFWGSLALCLYMNTSFGSCASTSGTIGICVDGKSDESEKLGITWNGLHGGANIYQPLKKGREPIQTLKFVFDFDDSKDIFVAKVTGASLEVNGNGKSLQMADGKGTITFWLKDDGDKTTTLNLGAKDSTNPALIGNLVLDGECETNTFTGKFGGAGIGGNVTLGSFGTNSFSFTNQAKISGKITLQAGKTTIESDEKSTTIQGGIYGDKGSGELTFKDKSVYITGNLDNDGKNLGDSAVLANGGDISLTFQAQSQTITIDNKISVSNQNTSYVLIKSTKENSTLILSRISTQDGGSGAHIQFGGDNATLVFKTNPQHSSIEGSGDNNIIFDGENSTIQGGFSSSGLGKNNAIFKKNGRIEGNIYTQKSKNTFSFQGSGKNTIVGNIYTSGLSGQTSIIFAGKNAENTIQGNVNTSSGKTDIDFWENGSVSGKVYAENGENSISFNFQKISVGGFEVGGETEALNKARSSNGALVVSPIAFGDGIGNSIYVKNSNGRNSIQIPQGSITITHAITSICGRNHIATEVFTLASGGIHAVGTEYSAYNIIITQSATIDGDITAQNKAKNILDFKGDSPVTLGDQSPLAILSGNGKNILSFSSGGNNILNLTKIHTSGGENHLGKTLLMETTTFNRPLAKYDLSSSNAFSGKMIISQGISTAGGKNIILFSATSSQNSSIISHFTQTHSTFSLQNAIFASNSGSNSLWLNTSNSSLPSLKSASETYLETPHSPEDLETLALSATISGNISAQGGDNHIFIKGSNEKDKTSSALFGNINTEGGSNNLDMKDTLITPSSLISSDGKITDIGGGLSGNIITTSGTTNLSTSLTHSPFDDTDTLVYTLASHGGESNLSFDGEINVRIKTRYKQGSRSNLIFATLSEGGESSLKTKDTDLEENKILGKTYKNGFKVTIRGASTSSPLSSSITSTHNSNHHTLSLGGTTFGIITLLDFGANSEKQTTKTPSVIIESCSEFWGNIKPNAKNFPTLTLKERAKVVFKDIDNTSKNNFSIPTLSIEDKTQNYPSATIGIATPMKSNDFGLLTIGSADESGKSTPKADTGLQGESGGLFLTRIKLGADQNTATLGGEKVGKYGYAYSDRIIIANIGDNSTAQSGVYFLGFFVDGGEGIEKIRYNSSQDSGNDEKGGAKTEGNIAVLTVVNTKDNKAGIDLKLKEGKKGFDKISGTLTSAPTDINGVYKKDGGYTTYFISGMTTNGVSQEREKVSAAALGVNYDLYMANFNSLNKRMGELRDNPYSQGVWGRIFGGVVSNDFGLQTKTSYITLQGGYDYAFGSEGEKNYLGLALSYGTSTSKTQNTLANDQEFLSIESTKSSAIEVALYNSYIQDEGWYNDAIAKFSYIFSTFSITGEDSTYSTSNMAFTLSDEFGYRFKLGGEREWFIDPQAEVALGYFNQTKFIQSLEDSWLENIAKGIFVMRSRFGSSFGYDFKKFTANKPIKASIYVGAFYEYDYIKGGDITLTTNLGGVNSSLGTISSDGRVVMNVGTNMTIKDNTRIYFDFEKSFAGKINTDYQINLGVRYSFGENPTPKSEDKKESLPLRIEQTDWEE